MARDSIFTGADNLRKRPGGFSTMKDPAPTYSSDVAFTPTVKAIQSRKGSRHGYAHLEEGGSWETRITPDLEEFIERQMSVFLGTANAAGQPYIQHRGGPPGFLKVLDGKTLAFADFAGNRQYITLGNLTENQKAFIFLIDYGNRHRVKIWGEARVVEDDPELLKRLKPGGYRARVEQAIVFSVSAWDSNCPQHIPQRFEAAEVQAMLAERDRRIEELTKELDRLRKDGNTRP
jgi:predicted pyridoxine 5'-phosphate oxidase superfamily flavin-nucleotide-binding protein